MYNFSLRINQNPGNIQGTYSVQKNPLTTRCLAVLNTPGYVLYPQLTTGVYWASVFRRVVSCDIGHIQGCLA